MMGEPEERSGGGNGVWCGRLLGEGAMFVGWDDCRR